MTTTPNTDKRRAAELLLAVLDDKPDDATAVLDAAFSTEGGMQGLIAALASGCVELLLGIDGEDAARKTLSMVLLDVQADDV